MASTARLQKLVSGKIGYCVDHTRTAIEKQERGVVEWIDTYATVSPQICITYAHIYTASGRYKCSIMLLFRSTGRPAVIGYYIYTDPEKNLKKIKKVSKSGIQDREIAYTKIVTQQEQDICKQ